MNCFRPDPYDYSLKAIPKTFETAKVLLMSLENGKIELRSRKGALLESMPLTEVQWSPCSVPAGGDHCLSIQYKQPQPREILLSARSRAAVHHLIRALDRAATATKQKNLQTLPGRNPSGEVSATIPTKPQQKEQVSREQVRDAGTSADIEAHIEDKEKEFQQILEQQESHWIRQMETLQKEFSLKVSECSDMKKEVEAARSKIKSVEAQLKNSAADIASKMKQLENVSLECKEMKTTLHQTQEEKEILISALTNAQAQLHDVQKAFRDTVEQLEVASLSCADAKRQATKAQEESCRQKDQLRDVNTQLKALQADYAGLQAELKEKTGRWAMEKQRMEDDLSRLLQSHSTNPNSEVSKWRSIAEASNIEKARAEAVLQSHRKTEAEATKEVESLRERLATSLANYAALVKEKNELETILDQVKVDLQRTRRKVDALESRGRYPDRTLSLGNKNAGAKTHPTTQFNDASVHVFSTP